MKKQRRAAKPLRKSIVLEAWLRYPLPPPLPLPSPYSLLPVTVYSLLGYPLPVTPLSLCPLLTTRATCPGHASLLGLTTTVCLALPVCLSHSLSLPASSAAFVCLPVNQRFVVVVVVMLPTPDRHLQLPHCQCRRCHPRKYFFENIFTYTIFFQLRNS